MLGVYLIKKTKEDVMIYYIILVWNIFTMFLYGIDKLRARKHKWRISETALIVPAFLFGGFGAIVGMVLFNHKTSKMKFRLLVPLAFLMNIALFSYIFIEYITIAV